MLLIFIDYYCDKVEHFAPYLLKDGLVIRITKYRNNLNIDELRVIRYGERGMREREREKERERERERERESIVV